MLGSTNFIPNAFLGQEMDFGSKDDFYPRTNKGNKIFLVLPKFSNAK